MLERHNRCNAAQQEQHDGLYGFAPANRYGGDALIRKIGLTPEDERKDDCDNARKLLKI